MSHLKNHAEGIVTFIIIIVADIVLNFMSFLPNSQISISPFENVIAGLLALVFAVLMQILFKFKDIENGDKNTSEKLEEIEDTIKILPDSRIQTYRSVDEAADDFLLRVKKAGIHTVDLALLDTKIRTPSTSASKINKMRNFVDYCNAHKEIKFRLLFNPASDSITDRYKCIVESFLNDTNSYFAYQESTISFASILIIDDNIVSIRTPFKDGSKTAYCVVKNKALCDVYTSWFTLLWNEATCIDMNSFSEFDDQYRQLVPEADSAKVLEYINKMH